MDVSLQSLGGLLPLDLLRQLHGADGARPNFVRLTGAALLIDVSRYTALVESLSHRGQSGMEQIPKTLDQPYSLCVEQIVSRGGDVYRFTGDSILAFWLDTFGNPRLAVRDAAACAEVICRNLQAGTDADDSSVQPEFHAGLGCGDIWIAAVSGDPHWQLLAGGDACSQASDALGRAGARQVQLSREANAALAKKDTFLQDAAATTVTEIASDPSEEWVKGFLPPRMCHLFERLQENAHQNAAGLENALSAFRALAEIRPMTVIFIRVYLRASDILDVFPTLQTLCLEIQSELNHRDGPTADFIIDKDGLICLAAFGETGSFHRDDPQRALEFAIAIENVVHRLELKASIGVATGDVLHQIVGNTRHLEPILFGQPVNRAARLMNKALEGVHCDSQTQRVTRDQFNFQESEALQLAGLGQLVPVFRPVERQVTSRSQTGLIGRADELTWLLKAHEEVKSGAKRLVAVIGEPGIGKTTLINAFARNLSIETGEVVVAHAERDDRRTSMLAWRRVLTGVLKMDDDNSGLEVYDAIRDRIPDASDLADRLPLLGDLLAAEQPETASTLHLKGANRVDAAMRLVGEVINVLVPRPFTLVLEDSQWLDSASWRLLEWIFGSLDSILVVLCVRVGEMPKQLDSLYKRAERIDAGLGSEENDLAWYFRPLQVRELDDVSVKRLMDRILDDVPPHDDVAQRITELAGGNPLFVEEITLTLKNQGLISIRDGCWQSTLPLTDLAFFEGVEKVIRERVDRLDQRSRSALEAASVVGRSFAIKPLEALLGFEPTDIINDLTDAQLIRRRKNRGFEFRHDQIRDVVYQSIPSERRRALHRSLALWLEAEHPDAEGRNLAALVQHFEAAGLADHAVKYADIAATNALRTGAYREVESFISICLEHKPHRRGRRQNDQLRSVRWRRQLAEAHYGRGDIQAQGKAIRQALDAAGEKIPSTKISTVFCLVERGLRIVARQYLPLSRNYVVTSKKSDWDGEIARCLNQAATVDYFELRFVQGMCNLLGAVNRSENTGISVETVLSNCQLAAGLGMMGWRTLNARLMNRAEQVAIKLDDPSLHAHVCTLDALWRLGFCEWDKVDERLEMAQALAVKSGDQLRWCNAQGIRFWSQYYRGNLSALEETAYLLLLRAQNAGNIQQEVWALRCKALCLLHIERPREAVDILRLTTSGMSGSVDLAAQISAVGALALALTRIGNQSEGFDAAAATLKLLDKMRRPSSHSVIVGISSVLEVLLRGRETGFSDRYEDWNSLEKSALSKMEEYSKAFSVGQAQLGMWRGTSHRLDGKYNLAIAEWAQAKQWADTHRLRKDSALIAAEIRRWQSD